MAPVILQAIVTYFNGNPRSGLTDIDMVIFQTDMIGDFVNSMREAVERKASLWSRLKVKVSKWFAGLVYGDGK